MDKENKRPYRIRQPAAFDVEKKEYLCPLCERLCNTAIPLVGAAGARAGVPPALTDELFTDSVRTVLQLKHQVSLSSTHVCTEFCEDMHCQARARSVGAMSSDMEEESGDEYEVFVSTHSENLLSPAFLVHFEGEVPVYNELTKQLIEEFAGVLPMFEYGDIGASAALYRSTSYTILSSNAVLQAEKRPLLGDLPARHRDALQALIRLAAIIPATWSSPKHLAHHALSTLNTLENTSPLTHELFFTLVALVLSAPSMFSKAAAPARPTHLARQFTLRAFRALITRAMLIVDFTSCRSQPMDGQEDFKPKPDLDNLLPFIKSIRKDLDVDGLNANEVWELIRAQCHNFLRCCCLFFHFLSDINPPTELTVAGGDTWEVMCGYLDMPSTFRDLIDTPLARKKVAEWAAMPTEELNGFPVELLLEPAEPPRLIPLPEDFSELMNIVSEFSCPNSEREDSKNPTMCLVCGQILCSQSYCCQAEIPKLGRGSGGSELVGAGVAHCVWCGAGAGVFLRVRDCELLLLAAPSRGAKLAAPYLDTYGETDQGLRRGNPLHLCPERYEALRMLWLSHSVHERIARAIDTNLLVTTNWQNL